MKPQSQALLTRAHEELLACALLIDGGHPAVAVSRAYYATFYSAQAMLLEEGLQFSSHGAVHGAFGQRFARSGRVDPKFHRYVLEAFRHRQAADYRAPTQVSVEDATAAMERAREFVAMAQQFLAGPGAA